MDESPKLSRWLHIRVTDELIERIKKLAKKDRRTVTDYVRVTIEKHADEQH